MQEKSTKTQFNLLLMNWICIQLNQNLKSLWSLLTDSSTYSRKAWSGIMLKTSNSKIITGINSKNIMDLRNMKWFTFKTTLMKKRKINSDFILAYSSTIKKSLNFFIKSIRNFPIFGKIHNKNLNLSINFYNHSLSFKTVTIQ